jgi:hypothetical protein
MTGKLRLQDVLFGILCVALVAMLAFDLVVVVLALVGAFVCGSLYLFAGMLPPRQEGFWSRIFTTVFLAVVLSSLVLIVPGSFGSMDAGAKRTVAAVAGLLPLVAICFEIVRTPRVIRGIWRCLGR